MLSSLTLALCNDSLENSKLHPWPLLCTGYVLQSAGSAWISGPPCPPPNLRAKAALALGQNNRILLLATASNKPNKTQKPWTYRSYVIQSILFRVFIHYATCSSTEPLEPTNYVKHQLLHTAHTPWKHALKTLKGACSVKGCTQLSFSSLVELLRLWCVLLLVLVHEATQKTFQPRARARRFPMTIGPHGKTWYNCTLSVKLDQMPKLAKP